MDVYAGLCSGLTTRYVDDEHILDFETQFGES